MDLGTLGVSNGYWNIGGTDKMNLRTLGVQIKWILEHWGYGQNGS